MFNRAIRGQMVPKYLISDHDPLYRFHQWQTNLRVLGVTEIKTVPYAPLSHPFVERLIERFDANTWTRRCSGPRQIWKRSCWSSRTITMNIALMLASAGRHLAIMASPFVRICNFIGGENTVTRYFRHPSRRELEFATDRLTEASTLIFCPCYRSLYDECFCRCARMEFWRKTRFGLKPQLVLRSPSSHVICLESPATEYSTFAFRVFWNSSSVSPRIAA